MVDVQAYRKSTCYDVRQAIGKFISDNIDSRSVEHRWLAHTLKTSVELIHKVESNSLSPDHAHRVREFRLSEIAAARAKVQDEINHLEDEARKLHGQAKVA